MTFDCIIPTYNNLQELKSCLAGFTAQTFRDFRLLVCIDGSTDGTAEWLRRGFIDAEIVICEHADKQNHGRNATRNLALPHLQSPYLCFVDSDLVPEPDLLQQHLEFLRNGDCISVGDVVFSNSDRNFWADYSNTRGKNKYEHAALIPYYYLATGNCAHKSEYFIALGGQDEKMSRYGGGDTEYAIRLHQQYDAPVLFNKHAIVRAEMNKSLAQTLVQLENFGRENLHYIHRKHPDEQGLFMLHRFVGTSLADRIFRIMLRIVPLGLLQKFVGLLPRSLRLRCINVLVMGHIWRGWSQTI